MKLFITDRGFGWCDVDNSPCIPASAIISDEDTILVGKDGAVQVVAKGTKIEGFSDVRDKAYSPMKSPDGNGGWDMLPPTPKPETTAVGAWKLKTLLAEKDLEFYPNDSVIAARWQYEPSFAIDGVVAKALQASLGYDDAQLQALFNEAEALK